MRQVNFSQAGNVKANVFAVYRVANGWMVQMPHVYQRPQQQNVYEGLVPALKEVMKFQDEDPLLSDLRGDDEPMAAPLPIIGRDESLYVCKTFQDVVELLSKKFGNLKE
jgi:hypothetical protein